MSSIQSSQTNVSYLDNPINGGKLPIELVNKVLSELDLVSLSALSRTSRFFNQLADFGGHWKGAFSEKVIKVNEGLNVNWGSKFNFYLSASYCTLHDQTKNWKSKFINSYHDYIIKNNYSLIWSRSEMENELNKYCDPEDFAPHVQNLIALRWANTPHPIFVCEGIRQGLFGTLEQATLKKIAQKLCNAEPNIFGYRVISRYIDLFGIADASFIKKIKADAIGTSFQPPRKRGIEKKCKANLVSGMPKLALADSNLGL